MTNGASATTDKSSDRCKRPTHRGFFFATILTAAPVAAHPAFRQASTRLYNLSAIQTARIHADSRVFWKKITPPPCLRRRVACSSFKASKFAQFQIRVAPHRQETTPSLRPNPPPPPPIPTVDGQTADRPPRPARLSAFRRFGVSAFPRPLPPSLALTYSEGKLQAYVVVRHCGSTPLFPPAPIRPAPPPCPSKKEAILCPRRTFRVHPLVPAAPVRCAPHAATIRKPSDVREGHFGSTKPVVL